MRKMRFFRFKVFMLALPVLALLVVANQSSPSRSEAFGPFGFAAAAVIAGWWGANNIPIPFTGSDPGDEFSCWVTGPLEGGEDDSWGSPVNSWGDEDEFVIDRRDLGHDARFEAEVNPDYLDGHDPIPDHESQVYTLFDSLSELVEYGFALDVADYSSDSRRDRSIYDRRVRLLALELLAGQTPPLGNDYYPASGLADGEDSRMLLPWEDLGQYRDRRAIGIPYDDAIVSSAIQWHDPTIPQGGNTDDTVAMAQDEVSNWIENMESTTSHAGGGGIIHYGTSEAVGQQVLFQADEDCGNTGVCNGLINFSSNPVPLTMHTNIREQNDGQFDENVVGPGERVMLVGDDPGNATTPPTFREVEIEFDQRRAPPSGTPLLGAGATYARQFQPDSDADTLLVSIELLSEHRRDLSDYEPGTGYDPRALPAMGFDPWTYDFISHGGRDTEVNEWVRSLGFSDSPRSSTFVHKGYRQPALSRPYPPSGSVNSGGLTRESAEHIRWPVNFEDLNWYLYRLPSSGYRDPLWLYWLTPRGTTWLVNSAYGHTQIPFPADGLVTIQSGNPDTSPVPYCILPVDEAQFAQTNYRAPLDIGAVRCLYPVVDDWDEDAAREGLHNYAHFPFDRPGNDPEDNRTLNPDMLVKQGVESAEDVKSPLGARRLSRFSFSIVEGQAMGDTPPDQRGGEAPKRYGIPRDPSERNTYISGWKNESVNPNMPHLLVVTFYEARMEDDLKFQYVGKNEYGHPDISVKAFDLPKREIRRVVCRMMVYPSGFEPASGEMKTVMDVVTDKFGAFISAELEQVKAIIEEFLASVAEFPLHAGAKTAELACIGMAKVDDLTSLDNVAGSAPPSLVDREGRIRINAAQSSKNAGSDRCHRISSPPTMTCERSSDFIFQGRCTRLPEFKLKVRAAEFLRPPPAGIEFAEYRVLPDHEAYYTDAGEQDFVKVVAVVRPEFLPGGIPRFSEVADPDADPRPRLTAYNRGLTRVAVDWDFRWEDSVDPDIYDRITGFTVYVEPDQKSVPFEVPQGGIGFDLPKWVVSRYSDGGSPYRVIESQVTGFTVGGLAHYVGGSKVALPRSTSLVSLKEDGGYTTGAYHPVGSSDLRASFASFNKLVEDLPLAPGFNHGFRVAPYYGVPGEPGFRRGPISEGIRLSGDEIACNEIRGDPHDSADVELVRKLYDCAPGASVTSLGYAPDEWRPGLLSLSGTDICDDIFSSTPAGFTWDNPTVRSVWLLMSVIAGSVLFTLFAWQGLRMTVDIWLDPQPATGFRELMPRFLMAAALAAGSLVICQLVLTVASDLTCFVAQFTGMSMWGAIGETFGHIVDGYMAWYEDTLGISDRTLLFLLSNFLLLYAFWLVLVLVMVYILYLFAKVFLGMLIRIAFLAVLIAMSPIAFAFYASDATSHWTRKWISMFLGATFQQVIILIVIYIGVSMIGDFLTQGVEQDLTNLVVGMIIAFLTLSLAASVPDLVNPGANKMFSSFGQLGGMAAGAAMMVVSGGTAAAVGGARSAHSAFANRDRGDGPPDPSAPSSGGPGGGSPPGGSSGGVTMRSAPTGGNIMSSVSRQHLGPSGGVTLPSGAPSTGPSGPSVSPGGPASGPSVSPGGPASGPSVSPGGPASGPSVSPGGPASGPSVSPGGPASGPSVSPGGPASGPSTSGPSVSPGGPAPGTPAPGGGGYRLRGAPPGGTSSPGQGAPGSGASGGRNAESSPGFFSQVGQGIAGGWRSGTRWGAGVNTRASDLAHGRTFYKFGSKGDDAAQQVSRLRREMGDDRKAQKEFYAQLAQALQQGP